MLETGSVGSATITPLKPDVWYTLRWRLTDNGMAVFINERPVFAERKPYDLSGKSPVTLTSANSRIEVKAMRVIPWRIEKD
jgi:hypothetical protein